MKTKNYLPIQPQLKKCKHLVPMRLEDRYKAVGLKTICWTFRNLRGVFKLSLVQRTALQVLRTWRVERKLSVNGISCPDFPYFFFTPKKWKILELEIYNFWHLQVLHSCSLMTVKSRTSVFSHHTTWPRSCRMIVIRISYIDILSYYQAFLSRKRLNVTFNSS